MQTDRRVDPVNRFDNAQQKEKTPFALPPSSSHVPDASGTAGSSVWIDPVVQRNISATSFRYEKSRRVLPSAPTSPAPVLSTPPAIPRRASAHPDSVVKVRPRYTRHVFIQEDNDVTRTPTLPQPTMWQYETPEYEAESSLSSLSLVIADVPTTPPAHQTERELDKIDMLPGNIQRGGVAPLNTPMPFGQLEAISPGAVTVAASILPVGRTANGNERSFVTVEEDSLTSWTAGRGAHSPLARRIVGHPHVPMSRSASSLWTSIFSPLDHLRWWLLFPGRLEFLLWFSGAILLMSVTCIFLFVCLASAGWLGGYDEGSALPATQQPVTARCTPTSNGACVASTHTSSATSTPVITAIFAGPLEAGMSLRLQGRGFSTNGYITLTHDTMFPCQPDAVNADGHGTFQIDIVVGIDTNWRPGPHVLTAYDTVSKRSAMTTITLAPNPIGRGGYSACIECYLHTDCVFRWCSTHTNSGRWNPCPCHSHAHRGCADTYANNGCHAYSDSHVASCFTDSYCRSPTLPQYDG